MMIRGRRQHTCSPSKPASHIFLQETSYPLGTRSHQAGFSLIEVMIVVVILAILATLLAPKVMGRTDDAKRAVAKAQIKSIESALQLYKLDNGMFPSSEQG